MAFREHIAIRAVPVEVWAVVGDPSLMPLWNPTCTTCEPTPLPLRRGGRYKATFRMRGPQQQAWCEVIDCVPAELLRARYSGEALPSGGYVDEVFRLAPSSTGTRLTHAVDFSHSGLPWFVRGLMALVSTFGCRVGKSSLAGIKELVERPAANPPSARTPVVRR